jgi:hypothetical protein
MRGTYLARFLAKATISTIMTNAGAVVIAYPMLPATFLRTHVMLHHGLAIHVLGFAATATTRASVTAG